MTMAASDESCTDFSFVESILEYHKIKNHETHTSLVKHPALKAILKHKRMSGNQKIKIQNSLDNILKQKIDLEKLSQTLNTVKKYSGLCNLANISSEYLTADFKFKGRIYFIIGYDIGVASPPDILINLAHPKFNEQPSEIKPYIIHEIHHLGYFEKQEKPSLKKLNEKTGLINIIKWATQMEGLAVHSAYFYRKQHSLLKQDLDYRVYIDPQYRKEIVQEYSNLYRSILNGPKTVTNFGQILEVMSSEKRLWYQFGAIVSHTIESELGRKKLVSTLSNTDIFWEKANKIMHQSKTK